MFNNAIIQLTTTTNNEIILNDVLSFKVVKEYYTPYTTLTAEVVYPTDESIYFKKIQLMLNGRIIHCGLLDTVTYNKNLDFDTLTITSKSFTSLLCQNQLEPGIKNDISLNTLVDSFIYIPEITHEDNSTSINYIYIKPTSSLWEAIINLNHKLNNRHPYICENNRIMVTQKENPSVFNLTKDIVVSSGRGLDTTKIISDIHMQDIDGNYDTYSITNLKASEFNIYRHKQIDLDKQYLSNPEDALTHRINFSMRGYNFAFATYYGYMGEDICDLVNIYDYFPNGKICKIEITGNNGTVMTKIYTYTDNYISYST